MLTPSYCPADVKREDPICSHACEDLWVNSVLAALGWEWLNQRDNRTDSPASTPRSLDRSSNPPGRLRSRGIALAESSVWHLLHLMVERTKEMYTNASEFSDFPVQQMPCISIFEAFVAMLDIPINSNIGTLPQAAHSSTRIQWRRRILNTLEFERKALTRG